MALTHRTAERLRRLAGEIEWLNGRLRDVGLAAADLTKGASAAWKSADRLDDYLNNKSRKRVNRQLREGAERFLDGMGEKV